MIIITKHTIKVLKFIKRNDTPNASIILKKYYDDGCDLELINLCKNGYLICIRDDGSYTDFVDEKPLITSTSYKYWATPLTDKLLEDLSSNYVRWVIPLTFSFISLVLSVITFICTLIDKSPILVKLLE